jgi:hypothetical protein
LNGMNSSARSGTQGEGGYGPHSMSRTVVHDESSRSGKRGPVPSHPVALLPSTRSARDLWFREGDRRANRTSAMVSQGEVAHVFCLLFSISLPFLPQLSCALYKSAVCCSCSS